MKLVLDIKKFTITVYGDYPFDDILDEIRNAGLDPDEWVISLVPTRQWHQSVSYPSFFNDYEIKA